MHVVAICDAHLITVYAHGSCLCACAIFMECEIAAACNVLARVHDSCVRLWDSYKLLIKLTFIPHLNETDLDLNFFFRGLGVEVVKYIFQEYEI